MVKVTPVHDVDQYELNRKLRHACPRIKRWKSRIDEADNDVHRLREQAITRSPVYVAVQRGSRNIQIRTKTKPKFWRKWIQEGKKFGFDESFATPIHIPSEAYKYKRQVSFSSKKSSPHTSPRRSLPVSPVKSGIHSPIKVSVFKNEQFYKSPKKEHHTKGVPLLTLTPVPLNQVLKKKARIIGHVSKISKKGRWVEQDASLLTVPGKEEIFHYATESETEGETEDEREKRGKEVLNRLLSPKHTTTDTIKRLASARRRESPESPKDSPKSPKRSPKKDPKDVSEEESESDSQLYEHDSAYIKRKIRAAGKTSLMFSGGRRRHEDILEESEEEGRTSARDKSATLRKMKAAGAVRAALSPHKSPQKSPQMSPKETQKHIKKKIRAVGKTSAALSPRRKAEPELDEFGNVIETETDITTEKSPSSIGSIFRKIKTIARLSSVKAPDSSPTHIGSLMMRMRFLIKLSPRRKRVTDSEEEYEEEEEDEEGNMRKVTKRRPKPKSIKSEKEEETEDEDESEPKESIIRRVCGICCPCICRKKEPELMEFESGSNVAY